MEEQPVKEALVGKAQHLSYGLGSIDRIELDDHGPTALYVDRNVRARDSCPGLGRRHHWKERGDQE